VEVARKRHDGSSGEYPERAKTHEGHGTGASLTARFRHRTPAGSKALKSRARSVGLGNRRPDASNGTKARGQGNLVRLRREGNPLEGETLNTAVGRNKPTRPVVEQTVEGGRNAEDGP
jgi:hypothetical protein